MQIKKSLLLAAGKGERLRPLTNNIPKVMVDISGKPCLQYSIELLTRYGVDNIAVNTHYLPEKIKEYFGNGEKLGVNIRYSEEKEILGTSGALNNFREFFSETFFVLYGDVIHMNDLENMEKFHIKNKGIATIALDNRSQVGKGAVVLELERIVDFVEKPSQTIPGAYVNSGIYILEPEILKYIPEGFSDFGKDIFPRSIKQGERLYGFKGGEVIDIGTLEDLIKARTSL